MDPKMKQCPSCKEEINKDAKKCPKCQSDLRSWGSRHPILATILFLFIVGMIGSTLQNQGITPTPAQPVIQMNQKLLDAQKDIKVEGYVEVGNIAPTAVLKVTNNTKHPIDLFAFKANLFNNADEMQREQISGKDYFGGQSQDKLMPGKTDTMRWQLSLFPHATKIGNIEVIKVHYSDTNETIQ